MEKIHTHRDEDFVNKKVETEMIQEIQGKVKLYCSNHQTQEELWENFPWSLR